MSTTPLYSSPSWTPTAVLDIGRSVDSSMGTTVVDLDAGRAWLKALGNRQGPHCLACEWVGSRLADWFGLSVPDCAILDLPAEVCFALPRGGRTRPGPAFVSRDVPGRTWGGDPVELAALVNPADVTRLVVFDTWVRNCDRHPPDLATRRPNYNNVLLADAGPRGRRLMAFDHTHCFDRGRDLTRHLAAIGNVQDDATYGLFPAFVPRIDPGELAWSASQLRRLPADLVRGIVRELPAEWDVSAVARDALADLVIRRAAYLAHRIETGWVPSPPGPAGPATP
jgi:hypothetical protein